jgi:hypothetical protein
LAVWLVKRLRVLLCMCVGLLVDFHKSADGSVCGAVVLHVQDLESVVLT